MQCLKHEKQAFSSIVNGEYKLVVFLKDSLAVGTKLFNVHTHLNQATSRNLSYRNT